MATSLNTAHPDERRSGVNMPVNLETSMREAGDYLHTLHLSALAHVQDGSVSASTPPPCRYQGRFQVALPYFGLFRYKLASRDFLVDPNRVLFIADHWEFEIEHAVSGVGHSTLVVSPSSALVDEFVSGSRGEAGAPFNVATRPASMRLRLLAHRFLQPTATAGEPLYEDELVVRTLQEAFAPSHRATDRRSKIVDRTKEVLHARSCERLSLEDLATAVGVTPVYLTQEFSRSEGVPLYRYQLQLRLSRALVELPHCDDITGLALDLGFSSHSHFTSVFRKTFGLTPSEYRSSTGTGGLRARGVQAETPAADFAHGRWYPYKRRVS